MLLKGLDAVFRAWGVHGAFPLFDRRQVVQRPLVKPNDGEKRAESLVGIWRHGLGTGTG